MLRLEGRKEGVVAAREAGTVQFHGNPKLMDALKSTRSLLDRSDRINAQTSKLCQTQYVEQDDPIYLPFNLSLAMVRNVFLDSCIHRSRASGTMSEGEDETM